jgi:hypothetical protein
MTWCRNREDDDDHHRGVGRAVSTSFGMTRILCLDTDDATVEGLRHAGYEVEAGSLGYQTGVRNQPFPPHEFDVVIHDLKKPACYDSTDWGPGGNDNRFCKIVANPADMVIYRSGAPSPRYKLIHQGQMRTDSVPRNFFAHDVSRACAIAGTHVFLMLNPEWLRHVPSWEVPDFVGLSWQFVRTTARRVSFGSALTNLLPELATTIKFRLPIQFSISAPTNISGLDAVKFAASSEVYNAIGDCFGQRIELGNGTIWALPSFEDNIAALKLMLSRCCGTIGDHAVQGPRSSVRSGSSRRPTPVIEDAPGLTWRPHRAGWEACWSPRVDLVKRGYPATPQRLWAGTDPNEVERAHISDRCRALQADMLAWAVQSAPASLKAEGKKDSAAREIIRDVFVSHASEDKDEIARPLVEALVRRGISVWFDEYELRLGDSLRKKIEQGLRDSRHGLIIMSTNFFKKEWPQKELDALFARESSDKRLMGASKNSSCR